jgi:hypothetical protein
MARVLFDHYNSVLGQSFKHSRRINLSAIGLPSLDMAGLEILFFEAKVQAVVMDLPNDKPPGPDGFTVIFYKKVWEITKHDIMNVFNVFWALDVRSLHHLNDAYMVLLKKKTNPLEIWDYRPINLIHSVGKLITKCLANRMAGNLGDMVQCNQSAFIRGRCLQDNFWVV